MLSIALVLVLMIGVNQVFKMTADTVGTGQAMLEATRDRREFQQTLANDFANAMVRPPVFVIKSERVYAYMDQRDLELDRDGGAAAPSGVVTIDLDGADTDNNGNFEGDNNVIGEVFTPALYGSRNHRIDRIGFFTRGLARSKTTNVSGYDAYVWYGHLKLPGLPVTAAGPPYQLPGFGSEDPAATATYYRTVNPHNYFAKDWLLGRVGIVLKDGLFDGDGAPTDTTTTDIDGQAYTPAQLVEGEPALRRDERSNFPSGPMMDPTGIVLTPLGYHSASWYESPNTNYTYPSAAIHRINEWSQIDVANVTLEQFRADVVRESTVPPADIAQVGKWFAPLLYRIGDPGDPGNRGTLNGSFDPFGVATGGEEPFRYECYPDSLTPLDVQLNTGIIRGWPAATELTTQFMVEFAGDYVTQNNDPADTDEDANLRYGDVIGVGPDGVIDYIVEDPDTANGVDATDFDTPGGQSTRIRWYGLPRDVDNDGHIFSFDAGNDDQRNNQIVDVVPLRDIIRLISFVPGAPVTYAQYNGWVNAGHTGYEVPANPATGTPPGPSLAAWPDSFEREVPIIQPDYATSTAVSSQPQVLNFRYTCVWRNGSPPLVRLITEATDARSRLADLRPAETVYRLPQAP